MLGREMKSEFRVHVWIDYVLMITLYGVRPLVPSSAPFVPALSPHEADIGSIAALLLL